MESYDRPLTSFLLYYYVYSMGQMENQSEEDVVCEKSGLWETTLWQNQGPSHFVAS